VEQGAIDLLVIGGGPAGSAAAIEAGGLGRSVIVIDKAAFPRDKCCGDGLTTGALRHLDELGFDPTTVPSWRPISDVVVRAPSGSEKVFPLPAPMTATSEGNRGGLFAAVARRSELDAALVERSRQAGATVLEGHQLVAIDDGADAVSATVEGPAGPMSITARSVVAADGAWSPTRKLLGLTLDGYRGDWHAFRQYFDNVDGRAADQLLVWFEPDLLPGYAWSFPVGRRGANVGFGILRQPGQSVQPMKDLWPRLLNRPHIADALGSAATPEATHRAWPIPARLGALQFGQGRVIFVGDALAAADPMTGEGIGQALETGRLAVQALAAHHDDPAAALAYYKHELSRGMQADHRLAALLSKALSNSRGVNASVAIAGATGWTRRNFARWLFEDYPRASVVTPRRWRRRLFTSPGAWPGQAEATWSASNSVGSVSSVVEP
jgi:geranylgeranyl reductase family protein